MGLVESARSLNSFFKKTLCAALSDYGYKFLYVKTYDELIDFVKNVKGSLRKRGYNKFNTMIILFGFILLRLPMNLFGYGGLTFVIAMRKIMNNLTVLIITRNCRKLLLETLESVRGIADEIIISDEGSTDGTVELAKNTVQGFMTIGIQIWENERGGSSLKHHLLGY